jgi:Tfp pilus assembly protein PilZ
MRLLTVAFGSPAEFLACYTGRLVPGGLFCPTRATFHADEEVVIEVAFPHLPNRTMLRGRAHTGSCGMGGWIRLDPSDARARDFLLSIARGDGGDDSIERSHLRIPASVPVDCRVDEVDDPSHERVVSETQDVGSGGVFIRAAEAPAVGTRLRVTLGPTADRGARFQLEGRVAWIRSGVEASRGFGVRFDRGGDSQRLRTMVRRAWESGRVEFGH